MSGNEPHHRAVGQMTARASLTVDTSDPAPPCEQLRRQLAGLVSSRRRGGGTRVSATAPSLPDSERQRLLHDHARAFVRQAACSAPASSRS